MAAHPGGWEAGGGGVQVWELGVGDSKGAASPARLSILFSNLLFSLLGLGELFSLSGGFFFGGGDTPSAYKGSWARDRTMPQQQPKPLQ